MVNSLATIPTELFEYILSFLPDQDIYSLRLTGQAICWRTTQDRFRSWLPTKKRVLMTEKSLTVFSRLPEQSLAASLLRHVVISGVVYNTETFEWEHGMPGDAIVYLERQLESLVRRNKELDKFYATGKHLTLLAQGLNNLARKPRNPGLCSVSLDVASFSAHTYQTLGPESCYSWEKVWRAAETAYGAFSSAMRDCTLSIEKLELFNVERCSLCLPEVNRNNVLTRESTIFKSTRSIYLSFCEELDIDLNSNEKHFDDRVSKFDGIVLLVKNAPRIERLVLHMLRIRPELDIYSEHLLRRMMNEAHLERLRELTLRGMKAVPEDLLNLLQNSNIAKLCLQSWFREHGPPSSNTVRARKLP